MKKGKKWADSWYNRFPRPAKKPADGTKFETVEEFLARGGEVTVCPPPCHSEVDDRRPEE